MGCCASSTNKSSSAPPSFHRHSSRAPPLLEEETVKEVLSETPTAKPAKLKIQEQNLNNVDKKINPVEVSEVSEICGSNLSESFSTTTVDDGEVIQSVDGSPAKCRNRSFSGDLKRERVMGKSAAGRPDPSPGRIRSIPGRETQGQWRDSGMRSRSPATRADGGGTRSNLDRSPSARKTMKSPGRIRSDLPENTRNLEEGGNKNRKGEFEATTNESLENPLMSFECFIFL